MNVNVYDFLMGVIVSISLLFFVLFYHIKLYKNHVFLKVWLLATGLVITGFIISLFSSNSNLSMIAIMISNLLLIASQVVYYISLKHEKEIAEKNSLVDSMTGLAFCYCKYRGSNFH